MSISPETLIEEDDEERRAREKMTGVLGNGLHVVCQPVLEDPGVTRIQHRAVCLTKPLPSCPYCPHRRFSVFFNGDPTARFKMVSCPRWAGAGDRSQGKDPSSYVATELATCESKPFEFCPSCPSQEELVQIGADKQAGGWYTRWRRFREEALEDE